MKKWLRIGLVLTGIYILVYLLALFVVPQYANHLMVAGYRAEDLSGFQKTLITVSDIFKNLGLILLPVAALLSAGIGRLVQAATGG